MPEYTCHGYDLAEIERKLTRPIVKTTVKACDFFKTNDILLQVFEIALSKLTKGE